MVHQYKVGDKVRIKEREGSGCEYPYGFINEMREQKDRIFTIEKIVEKINPREKERKFYNGDDHYYEFKEDSRHFIWHSSMFEPVLEDSEQKIQTITSLKEGDFISICGITGRIKYNHFSSGYYLNFNNINEQNHFTCCRKLEELVPDFKKIANKYNPVRLEPVFFPEFSTIDDLVNFVQAVNNAYNSKKSITTLKILNENEIRFQKPKASIKRGSIPRGNQICGRKCKTAIIVGHLSNKTVSC